MSIIKDINLARDSLLNSNSSIVIVKNGVLLTKKSGNGIRPLLDTIQELKKEMNGSIIGDKILGKASALLCIYGKVKGVYSPQSTESAISLLSREDIIYETDKIIPYVKNKYGDDICPFEKMIENIEQPIEAYKILKGRITKKI